MQRLKVETVFVEETDDGANFEKRLADKVLLATVEARFKTLWIANESMVWQASGLPPEAIVFFKDRFESCIGSAMLCAANYIHEIASSAMNGVTPSVLSFVAIREEMDARMGAGRADAAITKAAAH